MHVDSALARARQLALKGRFEVEPNPLVGAVLLDARGRLLGEGWHGAWGAAHAEVQALRSAASAGLDVRGATLCVTLEPCSTRGKTAACSEAVLRAGVSRVVVGARDPNPAHAGAGLEILEAAGLDVEVREDPECLALLPRFQQQLTAVRPWVVAKWAMSQDGAIATPGGEGVQLSGPQAQARVHAWRAHLDAILVGVGTVLADDPQLTARGSSPSLRPLRRVVLDPELRTPLHCSLVRTADRTATWIYTTDDADEQPAAALENQGVRIVRLPGGDDWLGSVLGALRLAGTRRLMVEGGAMTLGAFFGAGFVDQACVFRCPTRLGSGALQVLPERCLGGRDGPGLIQALALEEAVCETLGDDLLVRGYARRAGGQATT